MLFVQHRIAAEAEEVWEPLTRGARVYVCATAPEWRRASGTPSVPCSTSTRRTPTRRPPRLNGLIADGRYAEDVYAAG